MKAIAARAIPIPESLDIYFLDHEYPASDITALEAVMESNDEVARLEKRAEMLNNAMADADDEQQAEIQATCKKHFHHFPKRPSLEFFVLTHAILPLPTVESIYERLDALDASAAKARATSILHGLGFTTQMQHMKTREFSGGWRMRVALARALFLPTVECLILDEPTNHLGKKTKA